MRITKIMMFALMSLALVACSGVDIQPADTEQFAAGHYRYYRWRTEPIPQIDSSDPLYAVDPIVRREVDAALSDKGYVLDPTRAQFTVGYLFATGMLQGEPSALASNISPSPRITPNRQVNQASVDNAIALGGVKETNNFLLQFNDHASNKEVWRVTMTKIVEDANNLETSRLDTNMSKYLKSAMKALPLAAP